MAMRAQLGPLLTAPPLSLQPENVSDFKLLRFLRGFAGVTEDAVQAFRDMAEYRAVREGRTFLDLCHDPDLAFEGTMQPRLAYERDAALVAVELQAAPREQRARRLARALQPVLERARLLLRELHRRRRRLRAHAAARRARLRRHRRHRHDRRL